jgi:hypothetical protein
MCTNIEQFLDRVVTALLEAQYSAGRDQKEIKEAKIEMRT